MSIIGQVYLRFRKVVKFTRVSRLVFAAFAALAALGFSGCAGKAQAETAEARPPDLVPRARQDIDRMAVGGPADSPARVYFTGDLSGGGVLAAYKALGVPVSGKVAIKLHMGEPGNRNYLRPEMVRELTAEVKGSFVDSNTAYGGGRGNTAGHLQAARDHGYTFAPVDILDSGGEIRVPIKGGARLKEAVLGANIMKYDWIISVAHFKGHSTAGFGGTFKNLAIGIASPAGKRAIHQNEGGGAWSSSGEVFFEKVIEYNMGLAQARPGRMLYINVLNNLSVDCDCSARAAHPTMPDIGILASTDPVALEKASLDMIYSRPPDERKHLVERIESRNGSYQVIYAEKMGLGSQKYELIRL